MNFDYKIGILLVSLFVVLVLGCGKSESTQICPAPFEITSFGPIGNISGVDILVVTDNSESMAVSQEKLAQTLFGLITALKEPAANNSQVDEIRVAFVSSDMGLQYGEGQIEDIPSLDTCEVPQGDNGMFHTESADSVEIPSGLIECSGSGDQCPAGFSCEDGRCVTFDGSPGSIDCDNYLTSGPWLESSILYPNDDIAEQSACRSLLGTNGCQIEQPLEAAVRAIQINELEHDENHFMRPNHLLFILIVSDEDDCSIENPGLFETPQWESGLFVNTEVPDSGHLGTACNFPPSNEADYLFSAEDYYDNMVNFAGNPGFVSFAAIIGAPMDTLCEGRGSQIVDCLDSSDMQLVEQLYQQPGSGLEYFHFAPACTHEENGVVTSAKPGRRFVDLAIKFWNNGLVHSICSPSWEPAMKDMEKMLRSNLGGVYVHEPLAWELEPTPGCDNCGAPVCEAYAKIAFDSQDNEECPSGFDESTSSFVIENENDYSLLHCPIPKLNAPLLCDQAMPMYVNTDEIGWFYCENTNLEDSNDACSDNLDNNGNGLVDCEDSETCGDCEVCAGTGIDCQYRHFYNIVFTTEAKRLTRGLSVELHCLSESSDPDQNCTED